MFFEKLNEMAVALKAVSFADFSERLRRMDDLIRYFRDFSLRNVIGSIHPDIQAEQIRQVRRRNAQLAGQPFYRQFAVFYMFVDELNGLIQFRAMVVIWPGKNQLVDNRVEKIRNIQNIMGQIFPSFNFINQLVRIVQHFRAERVFFADPAQYVGDDADKNDPYDENLLFVIQIEDRKTKGCQIIFQFFFVAFMQQSRPLLLPYRCRHFFIFFSQSTRGTDVAKMLDSLLNIFTS